MSVINKILDIRIFKDSIYYKIVFILWALLHSLTLGQYITGYFSLPMIAWGGILLLRNLTDRNRYINKVAMISIYAFLAAYVVTIIVNRDSNFIGNTKTLIWQCIMMLVLFMSESWKRKEDIDSDIITISKTIIAVTMVLSLISLVIFFLNIVYWVNRVDGALIPIGYYYARLWGIYVDPNQAAVIAIISMLSSAIVIINGKYKKLALIIANIIIQYMFMILTASRGGAVGFIFAVLILGYLLFDYILRKKIEKKALRSMVSIVMAIVISSVIILSEAPTRKALAVIPNAISSINNDDGGSSQDIDIERNDLTSSNGRLVLWKDGLRLITYSPIIGFGDRNIPVKAKELTPGSSLMKKTVHNGFIHMVLSGGVTALVIMLILLISLAYGAVKVFFKGKRYNKEFYTANIISIMIGVLLITTLFLTEIFYQNSFAAAAFWIFLGLGACLNKRIINEDIK